MNKYYYQVSYTIKDEVDCDYECKNCPHKIDIEKEEYISFDSEIEYSNTSIKDILKTYIWTTISNGTLDDFQETKLASIPIPNLCKIKDITNHIQTLIGMIETKKSVVGYAKINNITVEKACDKLMAKYPFREYCLYF